MFFALLTLRLRTNVRTVKTRGCHGWNVVAPLPLGVEICLICLAMVFQVANFDVTWTDYGCHVKKGTSLDLKF